MTFSELDNLLSDKSEVTHVSHAGLGLGLRLIADLLAVDDGACDVGSFEQGDSEGGVVAAVHWAVEYLLNDIVYYVVQEVVPWISEEKVLSS